MCKVRDLQGVWSGLSQDATGSRWRVLSVQRREPNETSNPTAAIDRHDFFQCRPEVCWQIRRPARWRHHDKQGGDTIVTVERVRDAIAFNAELADESTWLWLTSEQMGFPLRQTGGGEHEEKAEDLDSSQGVRDHLVAYHLTPAITDFISNENRVCCNNDLEQTLMLLHSEWSKEIEPSGQRSTHHLLVVSNPIDKKGSEFMRRSMRWKAPSMPTSAHDPGLLREQDTPLVIG